jgi:hypothetical protein
LEGALGHGVRPVSNLEVVCWPRVTALEGGDGSVAGVGEAKEAHSTASLEYIRVEENGQRNTSRGPPRDMIYPATESSSRILHKVWCNSNKVSQFD